MKSRNTAPALADRDAGNDRLNRGLPSNRQDKETRMAHHKFKVGQLVDFAPSRPGVALSGRQYEIVRQLPAEGSELQYRVKSRSEPFERIAKESELSRRPLT
jgi:hypothetical protein